MPLLTADKVWKMVSRRGATRIASNVAAKFKPGDTVVARNINPFGHTRLPRYVRGRKGVVRADYGVFAFPDTNAQDLGPKPQHVYSVQFTADELWGRDCEGSFFIYVDLWDDYLDPA